LMLLYTGRFVVKRRLRILYSGEYGHPPRWKPWFAQTFLYLVILIAEKILVSLLLLFDFMQSVGSSILEPLAKTSETLELWVALLIMPLLINCLWFWVVDNLLMKAETAFLAPVPIRSDVSSDTAYELLVQHSPTASDNDSEMEENI